MASFRSTSAGDPDGLTSDRTYDHIYIMDVFELKVFFYGLVLFEFGCRFVSVRFLTN